MNPKKPEPGSERARDEQRVDGGPRYGGEPWKVADERGEHRFGHARNDDADLAEVTPADPDLDEDAASADEPEVAAAGEVQASAAHAGMGRGEHPRDSKSRDKG